MKDFDKDNIPEKVITDINKYVNNEGLRQSCRSGAKGMHGHLHVGPAMHTYHHVAIGVEPKGRPSEKRRRILTSARRSSLPLVPRCRPCW